MGRYTPAYEQVNFLERRVQELEERIQRLEDLNSRMSQFVYMIANDYVELSQDKVRWQRDDYIIKARQLTKAINPQGYKYS